MSLRRLLIGIIVANILTIRPMISEIWELNFSAVEANTLTPSKTTVVPTPNTDVALKAGLGLLPTITRN